MLKLKNVSKHFGNVTAVENVSLTIPIAEHRILFGPSGCGKTTLLRLIAGLEQPGSGTIQMNGDQISTATELTAPWKRNLGFVFQDSALWSHMTVLENLTFGQKYASEETKEMAEKIGLIDLFSAYPKALSGGQARRVALARALASRPRYLLLDEPYTNLDRKSMEQLLQLTKQIAVEYGSTVLCVTHNQDEVDMWEVPVLHMENGRLAEDKENSTSSCE